MIAAIPAGGARFLGPLLTGNKLRPRSYGHVLWPLMATPCEVGEGQTTVAQVLHHPDELAARELTCVHGVLTERPLRIS